jgi:hypothetical protein
MKWKYNIINRLFFFKLTNHKEEKPVVSIFINR